MIPQVFLDFYKDFDRTKSYLWFPADLYRFMMGNFFLHYNATDTLPLSFYKTFLQMANTKSFRNFCQKNDIKLFSQLEIQIWLFLQEELLLNEHSLIDFIGQLTSEEEKNSMLNALEMLKTHDQLNRDNLILLLSSSGGNFFENKAAILLFNKSIELAALNSDVINYEKLILKQKSCYFSIDDLLAFSGTPNFHVESLHQLTNLIFETLLGFGYFKENIVNPSIDNSDNSNRIKDNLKMIKGDLNQYLIAMKKLISFIDKSYKSKKDIQLYLAITDLNKFFDMSFDYDDAVILFIFICTCSRNETIRVRFPDIAIHEKRREIISALNVLVKVKGYSQLFDINELLENLLQHPEPYALVKNVICLGEKKFVNVLYSVQHSVDYIGEILYLLHTKSKIKCTRDNLTKITAAVNGQSPEIIACILRMLNKLQDYKMLTEETFIKWMEIGSNKRLELCSLVDLIFVEPSSILKDINAASNKRIGIFELNDWRDLENKLTLEILNVLFDNYIHINGFKQNNFVEWLLYTHMFTRNNLALLLTSASILAQISYNYSELTDQLRCNILHRIMFYLVHFSQDSDVVELINNMIKVLPAQPESFESEFDEQSNLLEGTESLITLPECYGISDTFKLITPVQLEACAITAVNIQEPIFGELYTQLQYIKNSSYLYLGAVKMNLNNFLESFTKVMTWLEEGEHYAEILEELHESCLYNFFMVYNLPPRKEVVKFFGTLYVQLWQASSKTLTHIELVALVNICETNNIQGPVLQLLRENSCDNLYLPYLLRHEKPEILVDSLIMLQHEVENSSCVKVYLDHLVKLQTSEHCINFMKAIIFLDATDWFTNYETHDFDKNVELLIKHIDILRELLALMERMQSFQVLTQQTFLDFMSSNGRAELFVESFTRSSSSAASEAEASEFIQNGVELQDGKIVSKLTLFSCTIDHVIAPDPASAVVRYPRLSHQNLINKT